MEKKSFFLFFLILLSFDFLSQVDSNKIDSKEIKLKVRLINDVNKIKLPSYCGYEIFYGKYEFEVIEVILGAYSKKTIFINVSCPREWIQFEKVDNKTHFLFNLVLLDSNENGNIEVYQIQ
jgi:hypothetical protein